MTRVKSGIATKKKHRKVMKLAKGYWQTRHKLFKKAKEAVLHAGEYAFAGRKSKKRAFRQLWTIRINAALAPYGLKYSQFINQLHKKKVALDRKILSQIALDYPKVFEKIVGDVK